MLAKKRWWLIVGVVCLLLFSMVSTAAACTVESRTIRIPVQLTWDGETLRQSGDTRKVEVPIGDTGRKITIYYRFNLGSPATPAPVPQPDSVPEPPAPEPPAPEPPAPQPPAPQPPAPQPPAPQPPAPQPPAPQPPAPEPPAPEPPAPEPPASKPDQTPDPGDRILSADERQMWLLVNEERAKHGLHELKIHEGLVELARKKSEDMVKRGYFSHYSPTYGSPFDMIRNARIPFTFAGENIAGSPTVSRAHHALMNSPGHRANILNHNYTYVGIGIVDGGRYGKMFTQLFIRQ